MAAWTVGEVFAEGGDEKTEEPSTVRAVPLSVRALVYAYRILTNVVLQVR